MPNKITEAEIGELLAKTFTRAVHAVDAQEALAALLRGDTPKARTYLQTLPPERLAELAGAATTLSGLATMELRRQL